MGTSPTLAVAESPMEDLLSHLPCSSVVEYKKGQIIYDADQPAANFYLVIQGKVKVSRPSGNGHEVVTDIYQADDLFGESAFLGLVRRGEQAKALEGVALMAWSAGDIEAMLLKRPKLAIALLQVLAQRVAESAGRLASFSRDTIARRLARCLIRLSERLGTPQEDGSVSMMPLTHECLAQYVGTSREIVTHSMTGFRRQGYLKYSRRAIVLHPEALRAWLRRTA